MLTARQKEAYHFIVGYMEATDGVSPSCDEIAAGLGLTSKGNAHRLLCALEDRGAIRRFPGRARALVPLPLSRPRGIATTEARALQPRGAFIDTRGWKAMVWDDEAKMLVPMEGKA